MNAKLKAYGVTVLKDLAWLAEEENQGVLVDMFGNKLKARKFAEVNEWPTLFRHMCSCIRTSPYSAQRP